MSKIIAILIVVMLIIPQQGLCLRPVATDSSPRTVPITSPHTKLGPATIAFRIMNAMLNYKVKENVTIMITYKCILNCSFCLAKDARIAGKGQDADKESLYRKFDALRGFKKIHIEGTGEPLMYGMKHREEYLQPKLSKDFIDIVTYAAKCVDEVRIVTSAYLVPEDEKEAEEFFRQFPQEVLDKIVWVVSTDMWHNEAVYAPTYNGGNGKDLKSIIEIMKRLEAKGMIRIARNVSYSYPYRIQDVLSYFEIDPMRVSADRLFIRHAIGQGEGKGIKSATLLKVDDIHEHSNVAGDFSPYIDEQDSLLACAHSAYMTRKQRKKGGFLAIDVSDGPMKLADTMLYFLFERFWDQINFPTNAAMDANFKRIIKAILFYYSGRIEMAKECVSHLDLSYNETRSAILKLLYYLIVFTDGIDLRPFVRDCLDWEDLKAPLDEYHPDFETAFRILSSNKEKRRLFENETASILKWIDGSRLGISNEPCPAYEATNEWPSGRTIRRFRTNNGTLYRIGSKQKALQRYYFELELASFGFTIPPLGLVHNIVWYYLQEQMGGKRSLCSLINSTFYNDSEEELVAITKNLGILAAKIDKSGFRINDLDSFNYFEYGSGYENCIIEANRTTGEFIVGDASFLTQDPSDSITTKELFWVLYSNVMSASVGQMRYMRRCGPYFKKILHETRAPSTHEGFSFSVKKYFDEGYEEKMGRRDTIPVPKAVYGSAPEPVWEVPPAVMAMSQAA